eukprot:218183_1
MFSLTVFFLIASFSSNVFASKPRDWLITDLNSFPNVTLTPCNYNGFECIELSNTLISRKFIISPNFFTIEYNSYIVSTQPEYALRSPFSPEAIIGFNYKNYSIGGVSYINNTATTSAFWDKSFLNKNNIQINSTTWTFINYSISTECNKLYNWTPGTRGSFKYINWPPKGLQLNVTFKAPIIAPLNIRNYIRITIQYEMYQGIPLMSKQIFIESTNPSQTDDIYLTYIQVEQLKLNIPYGIGERDWNWGNTYLSMVPFPGKLWIEIDVNKGTYIDWFNDIDQQMFKSNNYGGYEPTMITYYGPNNQQTKWSVRLASELPGTHNGIFKSFRTFELFFNDFDLERQGLARRRMMSFMSPTITEAPIYTQTINMTNNSLYNMIEQCYNTGFEILAFSFDSGFNMETTNKSTLNYYKSIISYANSLGIEIGGYDLIMEDRSYGNGEYAVIGSDGKNENDLCFASNWVPMVTNWFDDYINIGMKNIITDGPYGGQACYSTKHTFHYDSGDSIFRQEYLQNEFFINIKNKGVYIHQPDNYYYFGGSKSAMGYNENQYSLPRWLQLSVSRMGMYDDTFVHTVTQGWMFLPLTAYHSNNADCYFEPLSQHIDEYNWALGQYFGYGVMAMMRGKELYDTQQVKNIVIKWTSFYNKHRQVLIGDIIHLRRCDMQWFDAILHVSPFNDNGEQGLAMIYNPTNNTINTNYTFSLYYTGIKNNAMVSYNDDTFTQYKLNDIYDVTLTLSLSPVSINYYVFKQS